VCKVVDLFSKKELDVKDLIPTPESELQSMMEHAIHCYQYHKVMGEYAKRIFHVLKGIEDSKTNSPELKWADLGPILDGFDNLIDISKPDHKAVIDSIFEDSTGYDKIIDPVLKELLKKNIK